jgi:hypothetical protein
MASTDKQFMLLFRDEGVDWSQFSGDDRRQALVQRFVDWAEELDKAGKLVGVDPLEDGGKTVRRKGSSIVVDGPYAEGREAVLGYYIVHAPDLEAACALAAAGPHTAIGGATEVREIGAFTKPRR